MIIHSYENSARADSCIEYLRTSEIANKKEHVILLPIPTTRDKLTILNTNIYINSIYELIDDETLVCGYGLPLGFVDKVIALGGCALDLAEDENFLLENGYFTPLCALGIILNTECRVPSDLKVGIVGYGRIGTRLTELLLYLGADVRVFTSRMSVRNELCENGISSSASDEEDFVKDLDILVNTAPARIFGGADLPSSLRIIDLASGENFDREIKVERYPSVPAKMFPFSSGRAWGRAIERFLTNID